MSHNKLARSCGKQYHKRCPTSHKAAKAMAAAAAIAGGTQIYAAPVRFDNPPGPGHFNWSGANNQDVWLDITMDAAHQLNVPAESGVDQYATTTALGYPETFLEGQYQGAAIQSVLSPYSLYYVEPASLGSIIPSGAPFYVSTLAYYNYGGTIFTFVPEGVTTYVAVEFGVGLDTHYGWIGVVRTGRELDAFAWGYETTPNTPIDAGGTRPGDVNCDGSVDAADVPRFVQALVDPSSFNTGCDIQRADVNQDGAVDGDDIESFLNLIMR